MKQTDRILQKKAQKLWRHKAGAVRCFFGILSVCLFYPGMGLGAKKASAAGATVSITTKNTTVTKGDTVYVVIRVSAADKMQSFEGYFSYDNRILQFVTGGSVVHGNDDKFRIQDTERESSASDITYSVKFLARKQGSTAITMEKPYSVRTDDDNATKMSVSYNTLNILVKKKAQEKTDKNMDTPKQSVLPSKSPEASASPEASVEPSKTPGKKDIPGSNKLRKLTIKDAEFAPDFSPKIRKYSVLATTSKKKLDITWEAQDSQAKVVVKGNRDLTEGKNIIKIAVTGTNGKKRVYRLSVTVQKEDKNKQNSTVRKESKEQKTQEEQLALEAQKRKSQSMKYMAGIIASFCGLLFILTIGIVMKIKRNWRS